MLNGEQFYIEVLTLSPIPIWFNLRTETYPAFQQSGPASFQLSASPAEPQYV